MKMIPINTGSVATADSADAGWPAANILDPIIKKCWKAANSSVTEATVSFYAPAGGDSLAVFGIVADEIVVTVSDPNAIAWETGTDWESGTDWVVSAPTETASFLTADLVNSGAASVGGIKGAAWFQLDEFVSSVQLTITVRNISGRAMTLSIGTAYVGTRVETASLKYGLTTDMVDHSIERELANGSIYYKKRDVVREFAGTLSIRNSDDYEAFWQVFRRYGRVPMPFILIDNAGSQWLIMGRMRAMRGTEENLLYNPIDITIREEF